MSYLLNLGIRAATEYLIKLGPEAQESNVGTFWNALLCTYYPGQKGYLIAILPKYLQNGSKRMDLLILQSVKLDKNKNMDEDGSRESNNAAGSANDASAASSATRDATVAGKRKSRPVFRDHLIVKCARATHDTPAAWTACLRELEAQVRERVESGNTARKTASDRGAEAKNNAGGSANSENLSASAISGAMKGPQDTMIYAALAVGRKVRFYEYTGNAIPGPAKEVQGGIRNVLEPLPYGTLCVDQREDGLTIEIILKSMGIMSEYD